MTYSEFFQKAMGTVDSSPYYYQQDLAENDWPELLDIPTGLGKTATVILAWIYKRTVRPGSPDVKTPRRLVYCLPMRVLVEQTRDCAVTWLDSLDLLGGKASYEGEAKRKRLVHYDPWYGGDDPRKIRVHLLMGGDADGDWVIYPEHNAILIGTQDMLLSRALNRGYAAGRARWPMEFGLLNNDCLWVFDEVQLMSTGLATSLQLDAWRKGLHLRGLSGFPEKSDNPVMHPCRSLWMSATMARRWLDSAIDYKPYSEKAWQGRHVLTIRDHTHERINALKKISKIIDGKTPVAVMEKPRTKDGKPDKADQLANTNKYIHRLAESVQHKHAKEGLTLVILNTVERAVALYEALHTMMPGLDLHLIHSRFRPMERTKWIHLFSDETSQPRVIVSTQVIEAGVDLSAEVLFTELAPWSSLVQRFGRCARYPGEMGRVFWMDVSKDESAALPYQISEVVKAKELLEKLTDMGLNALEALKNEMDKPENEKEAKRLFPYSPRFVPRERDLFDLFDTTPDLTGADVDISRFIRDDQEMDAQVFWREIDAGNLVDKKLRPNRREICPVAFYRFREQMGGLLKQGRIWRWSYHDGWLPMSLNDREFVYPGQVFLLEKNCGGYHKDLGWTGEPASLDFDVISNKEVATPRSKLAENDEQEDGDPLSNIGGWVSISEHASHVIRYINEFSNAQLITEPFSEICFLAARWHDRGKAHGCFAANLRPEWIDRAISALQGQPPAKAPDPAWLPPFRGKAGKVKQSDPVENKRRPGFRHELASALTILESLKIACPQHPAFAWPEGLDKQKFGCEEADGVAPDDVSPAMEELAALGKEDIDLLLYLVTSHHGKVRMSLRSSPDDSRHDLPDPCPPDLRQARGVRDLDRIRECKLPAKEGLGEVEVPSVSLNLDPMELGLSCRYGPSWRDRMQNLLERHGPFRLAYLEALLRIADWLASAEEDRAVENHAKHTGDSHE